MPEISERNSFLSLKKFETERQMTSSIESINSYHPNDTKKSFLPKTGGSPRNAYNPTTAVNVTINPTTIYSHLNTPRGSTHRNSRRESYSGFSKIRDLI